MRTSRLTKMPIELLWEYREFKRDEIPAPRIAMVHGHNVEEITQYLRTHGLEPLELAIVKDRALLTDGNHRIVAAKRLGLEEVPVNVTVFFGEDSMQTFYEHTLLRFKPISKPLEMQLKILFL